MFQFAQKLSLLNCCSNEARGGKVWLMWSNQINFDMLSMSDQGLELLKETQVLIKFVYAKCSHQEHKDCG